LPPLTPSRARFVFGQDFGTGAALSLASMERVAAWLIHVARVVLAL
jgi:hypothetical protein